MKQIAPLLVAALGVSGCASMGHPQEPSCNSQATCVVKVTARGCNWQGIDANPDVLRVKRGYKGPVSWKLTAPPGWEFADNGIEFKDATGEEFGEKRRGPGDFSFYNQNSKKGVYRYTINLTPPGGGKTCSLDPTIMNDQEP